MPESFAALALDRAIQKISSVKLNARLVCEDFEYAPAGGLLDARGQARPCAILIEHPVVIVALAELQFVVIPFHARTNRRRLTEIERRAAHRAQFSRWNQAGVDRREAVGV